jgi:hypothetical protein
VKYAYQELPHSRHSLPTQPRRRERKRKIKLRRRANKEDIRNRYPKIIKMDT